MMADATFAAVETVGPSRRVLIFSPYSYGHFPGHVHALASYWRRHRLAGILLVVVTPKFLKVHRTVVEMASEEEPGAIRFIAISEDEDNLFRLHRYAGNPNLLELLRHGVVPDTRELIEWQMFCRYAQQLQATGALLVSIDNCLLPIAVGMEAPCRFAGIQHQPTQSLRRAVGDSQTEGDKARQMQEKLFYRRLLSHRQLTRFFYHAEQFEEFLGTVGSRCTQHVGIPLRIEMPPAGATARLQGQLGVGVGRRVFLLFGDISSRKGCFQLLDALGQLEDRHCQRICLLVAGRILSTERDRLLDHIRALREERPVQIVVKDGFVPDKQVMSYFAMADIVLAVYPRLEGASGVLALAAVSGKPVLGSSNAGVGQDIRRYALGLGVDATRPEAIAGGIVRFLNEEPGSLCDPDQMRLLAKQSNPERFAERIFAGL